MLPNGLDKPSQEEANENQMKRDQFRDQVSKQMGELLLLGHTMLDAYCQICNGILMESRTGTRKCVACDIWDANNPKKTNSIQTLSQSASVQQDSEMLNSSEGEPKPANRSQLNGVNESILMLDKKISWLTKKMDLENEIEELMKYLDLLHKLAETMKALQSIN
ncbi:unnamed protein product, partial [Mesorhabditis belari]|uniref:Sjoegren syndrome/scleroderma autoantigen 1 n=1 Tax=Mesorhabditis belari TaxID=2138241 RepID=A0AAF3EL42_9BILA